MTSSHKIVIINEASLEVLNLKANKLKKITNRIARLTELKVLNLANNKLKRLPWDVSKMGTYLILDNNSPILPFSRGLEEFFHRGFSKFYSNPGSTIHRIQTHRKGGVQSVEIERRISSANETLDLSGLNLTNEQVAELMPRIAELPNLKELNLSSNNLTILPESIGELRNLEILNLENNGFTKLPDSINNLSNLKTLNLAVNDFTKLPIRFKKLETLNLSNNPNIIIANLTTNLLNLEVLILDSSLSLKNFLALRNSIIFKQKLNEPLQLNPKLEELFLYDEFPKVFGLSRKLTDINGKFLNYLNGDYMHIAEIYAGERLNINAEDLATLFMRLSAEQKRELLEEYTTPSSELVNDIEENNTQEANIELDSSPDVTNLSQNKQPITFISKRRKRRDNKKSTPKSTKIGSGKY